MTNRDCYELAAAVAALTGRDVMALVRWAACTARSDRAPKIAAVLQLAQRRFTCGQEMPRDFPAPVAPLSNTPVRLFNDTEEQDWL